VSILVSRFRARHSGVSNPSLCPGFRGFKLIVKLRSFFRLGLGESWAYDSLVTL